MSRKTTPRKLVATALGALAASIAAPALSQDAPINATTTPPPTAAPANPLATTATIQPIEAPQPETVDATEIALIGGALIGAFGIGGAVMLGRRRRSEEVLEDDGLAPKVTAAPPRAGPAPSNALTRGQSPFFEAARSAHGQPVGRHEAMVDAGPTAENPFLTRRARLRHARFLDERERAAAPHLVGEPIAARAADPGRARGEQVTHIFGKDGRPARRWSAFGKPVLAKLD